MKRIEIPIVERKDNNISNQIKTCNKSIFDIVSVEALWNKFIKNEEFTKEDLISLYDIYNIRSIEKNEFDTGLIVKIMSYRNIVRDMATIFDCDTKQITDNGTILRDDPSRYVVLLGNIEYYDTQRIYNNLRYIRGNCILPSLISINGKFPKLEAIGSDVDFQNLRDESSGLESLRSIGGDANFERLMDASGLCNLEIIGKTAYFHWLEHSNGLDKLKYIGGYANFTNLEDITHLSNLECIGYDVHLFRLNDEDTIELKKRTRKKVE